MIVFENIGWQLKNAAMLYRLWGVVGSPGRTSGGYFLMAGSRKKEKLKGFLKFVSFLQERQINMKKEIISEIMANGERNRPKDSQTDWNRLDNMSDEETHQNALSDPDAQPLSKDAKPFVNVKLIRAKLSMTQEEFAKTFQLSLATIRDWEQRRSQPDHAAKTLLRVIEATSRFTFVTAR